MGTDAVEFVGNAAPEKESTLSNPDSGAPKDMLVALILYYILVKNYQEAQMCSNSFLAAPVKCVYVLVGP